VKTGGGGVIGRDGPFVVVVVVPHLLSSVVHCHPPFVLAGLLFIVVPLLLSSPLPACCHPHCLFVVLPIACLLSSSPIHHCLSTVHHWCCVICLRCCYRHLLWLKIAQMIHSTSSGSRGWSLVLCHLSVAGSGIVSSGVSSHEQWLVGRVLLVLCNVPSWWACCIAIACKLVSKITSG
jgi:hypothetical protein